MVATPGVTIEGHAPLLRALREVAEVDVVAMPCSGDSAAMVGAIRRAVAAQPRPPVVVAHGIGATLVLLAAPFLSAERLVLAAPVLRPPRSEALTWLISREQIGQVDLGAPLSWRERPIQEVLLGRHEPELLTCVSSALVREVVGWSNAGSIPLDLDAVPQAVWIAMGLLDEVAQPEVLVASSRELQQRKLVRLGITRMDPRDFGHLDLLVDPIPIRAMVRAVARP